MSTKFFNNTSGNTLFDKLKGIASNMEKFERFLAVVGFFRSSGYFKLRRELGEISEIKILVGINIDDIFRNHKSGMIMFSDIEKAKELYNNGFKEDIINARYDAEIEQGILQLCEDLLSERLQMRIHAQKNLHAKFYLCLQPELNEHSDGWVIMGSSNISESGLGISRSQRYELNVAMKDYDDVSYCYEEFKRLWEDAVPLTAKDIENYTKETYLGNQPTPYELYLKVLIDAFGDQVEDDFSLQLPDGVKDLKYQKDAVIQGYQMLMRHNGLFLADVVGLGKTLIATMIAKRFIESNGRRTNILVIYPPALADNWKNTFQLFGIHNNAQFVTNGSLYKVLDGKKPYKDKEEFDLIIVDEAHGFRNDSSGKYDELQKICKSPCTNVGLLRSTKKKVMLLSATPLNNRPDDLLNLMLLFQDSGHCTIDGIPNLKEFFAPLIKSYNKLMKDRSNPIIIPKVDNIYEQIRERVIDKITVRRTRNNILNDPAYKADIMSQGITFPKVMPPQDLTYKMSAQTDKRFYDTLKQLIKHDDKGDEDNPYKGDEPEKPLLNYARYRAIEFLKPEYKKRYPNPEQTSRSLAKIYRTHMVKRLESSFFAFKKSLRALLTATEDMIKMLDEDKVLVIPDLNIKELFAKGKSIDEIIDYATSKGHKKEEFIYRRQDFEDRFREILDEDKRILESLNKEWEKETEDPKFDHFIKFLNGEMMNKSINPSGKLVLFSESVDTLTYLHKRITNELGRKDVLLVTAKNRDDVRDIIRDNFDANWHTDAGIYNIILTSDVLAEGVNLHRSNIIVNYDSPWNATRLMQRIGRVNRVGSSASEIYNYTFYPTTRSDKEIKLYNNALIKIQGFHSTFGEDMQVYSHEEIVKQFSFFDNNVKDTIDERLSLLREIRDIYNNNRKLYDKVKSLPLKSRVMRNSDRHKGNSVVFISSDLKSEFYLVSDDKTTPIDLLEAAKYLKAAPEEKPVPFKGTPQHYNHVNNALTLYKDEFEDIGNKSIVSRQDLGDIDRKALAFLRTVMQTLKSEKVCSKCQILTTYINSGIYSQLPVQLVRISRKYKNSRENILLNEDAVIKEISDLVASYHNGNNVSDSHKTLDPQIIISETFI